MNTKSKWRWDASATVLLLSNLLTISLALWQRWNLGELMVTYWAQSVIIGFFNWLRMLSIKEYTTDGTTMNDQPVPATRAGQGCVASFFALHYGIFHLAYFSILLELARAGLESRYVLIGVAGFGLNHAFSYWSNMKSDRSRTINLGTLMFFPYARIIPMHLTIILGGTLSAGPHTLPLLLLFLVLKTVADLIMHFVEHSLGKGSPDTLEQE